MKTIVLGAGIVGTATAYFLAKQGHEIEVVERQSGAALETSFGNGGVRCARDHGSTVFRVDFMFDCRIEIKVTAYKPLVVLGQKRSGTIVGKTAVRAKRAGGSRSGGRR